MSKKKRIPTRGPRTVTLADVRQALARSPFPRQYDEMVPLLFICEALAARPLQCGERPLLDVDALEGADIDGLLYASDTAKDRVRAVKEKLLGLAAMQRRATVKVAARVSAQEPQ